MKSNTLPADIGRLIQHAVLHKLASRCKKLPCFPNLPKSRHTNGLFCTETHFAYTILLYNLSR